MFSLEGITVLDFGFYLAGPITGRILADLGARVIKVEEPIGDPRRGMVSTFMFVQRGKEDIAIDLKSEEGRQIVYKLVERADVVVHNQRVGVAERLGIDYATLSAINPRLIYCHNAGYGSKGPRAKEPTMEPLHSVLAGYFHIGAGKGNRPSGYLGNMDTGCGLNGALTIVMALFERAHSGRGQYVEAPQNGASMYFLSDVYFTHGEKSRHLDLDHEQTGHGPLNRLYRTADDWICIACRPQQTWEKLCAALELPELPTDTRFGTSRDRDLHAEELGAILGDRFLAKTTEACFAMLDGQGIPCEIPQELGQFDFVHDPEHLATGAVADYVHPRFGHVREVGVPIGFSETPGRNRAPAPLLGQHTREILRELGYDAEEIAALRAKRVVAWEEIAAAAAARA